MQLIGEGKLILLEYVFSQKARHFHNFIESKQRVTIVTVVTERHRFINSVH